MHYALMRDVDCAETNEWNQGAGFFPIGYYQYGFSGTLDGQGHTIRHLYINRPTTDYVGLFGKLDVGATVRNLTVQGTVTGRDYAGLLAGWMLGGSVDSVKAEGSVTGNRGVGGIAGVSQGTIQGSRAQIAVSGREWVGGIAGWNYTTASVTTAVSKGTVSGTRDVGGIAGVSHGAAVRGCTADVTVSGAEPTGGIVGRLVGNGSIASTVEDCTFTGTVNGHAHGPIIGSRKEQQE